MTGVAPTVPPATLPLRADSLPLADLRPYPHAVTWALEWREGRNGRPGAWTKVPKDPRTGGNARSNDPATWTWVDDVLAHNDRFGFVVWTDDPFTFLDLDNAIDRHTGTIKPWARRILDRLPDAYWEYSTAGGGLKGLIRATVARNRIVKTGDGQTEIFSSHKFTALTGHRLPGSAPTIGDGQAALDALYRDVCGPDEEPARIVPRAEPPRLSDDELIARVRAARNGGKFARLFDAGDTDAYGGDHSRADQALISMLSFWTGDPAQLDRLMRRSALCRGKWTGRRDYAQRTIAKALASGSTYATLAHSPPGGLRTRQASPRLREAHHA